MTSKKEEIVKSMESKQSQQEELNITNKLIDVDALPRVEGTKINLLDPNLRIVRVLNATGFYLVVAVCIIAFGMTMLPTMFSVFLSLVGIPVFLLLMNYWLIFEQFKVEGYFVREQDIYYQQGYLWTRKMIIPFNRIQHASVHQGPIERFFGLSKIKIYTAGGQTSDLTIPGIDSETALKLKELISERTGNEKKREDD